MVELDFKAQGTSNCLLLLQEVFDFVFGEKDPAFDV
jgi:hypothetical protein